MKFIVASALLTLNTATASEPAATPSDRLATKEECAHKPLPKGKDCVSDITEKIRMYDGLSYVTNNIPAGSGLRFVRNNGIDRTNGPEDSDDRISTDEFAIPVAYVNEPWQTPICEEKDLLVIQDSVARGEIPEYWAEESRIRHITWMREHVEKLYCGHAAIKEIVIRRLIDENFRALDVNGDGFLSREDDTNRDNMITKEDTISSAPKR